MGLDDHVDLRRRFDQWGRDLKFFEVEYVKPDPFVDVLDAVWGDELYADGRRPWLR